MRFVHITKLEEAIPALRCGGGHGDREALRNQINRLGYALKEDFQFDVDAFAEEQFGDSSEKAAGFFIDALLQGAYRFGKKALRTGASEKLFELRDSLAAEPDVTVYLISSKEIEAETEKALRLGRCRNYARMLGDLPANYLTADDFCRYAQELVREKPALSLEIYRDPELAQMHSGGILAVNQASQTPAALLHLRYGGAAERPGNSAGRQGRPVRQRRHAPEIHGRHGGHEIRYVRRGGCAVPDGICGGYGICLPSGGRNSPGGKCPG